MEILSIETTCDETACAVASNLNILSSVVLSQEIHSKTFGVVPEVASRLHLEMILKVIDKALFEAYTQGEWQFGEGRQFLKKVDVIAVAHKPGLLGSLIVGVEAANTLALVLDRPILGINHYLGHLYSFLPGKPSLQFPILVLTVSGGHTSLYLLKDLFKNELLGKTRDDAAGEAFDKAASILNLTYPGGPAIEKLAEKGDSRKFSLPRPMVDDPSLDFSFSGLKTALLYLTESLKRLDTQTKADLAASFQEAVAKTLAEKTLQAAKKREVKGIALVGGVSANKKVREELEKVAKELKLNFYLAPENLRTDNAAMIAIAAGILLRKLSLKDFKSQFPEASAEAE